MKLNAVVSEINGVIWGFMLVLFVFTGVFLMLRLKFLPLRKLGYAFKSAFSSKSSTCNQGDISPPP